MSTPRSITTIDLLGTRFRFSSDDERWNSFLEILWEPFVAEPGPCHVSLELRTEEDGWELRSSTGVAIVFADPWLGSNEIRNLFVSESVRRSPLPCLHSAAVARDDQALLLIAGPGVGKTTLTLEFMRQGWSYMSDDLAPITPTGTIVSVPKPLNIKDPEKWASFSTLWEAPSWVPEPVIVFQVPVGAWARRPGEEARCRAALFLERVPSGGSEFVPMGEAAGTILVRENLRNHSPSADGSVARLAWSVRFGGLRFTGAPQAVRVVEEWWTGCP